MYSFVGVFPRESRSSGRFVWDTLWIIDVYFRVNYLGTSLPFKNQMALSKQRNGIIGIFHVMLKVLPSKMLESSTGMVSKKYKA